MLHQFNEFVIRHAALCAGFVIVFILLAIEEIRSMHQKGPQWTSAEVTNAMNRDHAIVIDIREVNLFRDGHIIGAKNFPLSELERSTEKLKTYHNRQIIVVDAAGLKIAGAVAQLQKMGLTKIAALKGGIEAWKADNMPVVKK